MLTAAIHNAILLMYHAYHTITESKRRQKIIRLQYLSVLTLAVLSIYATFAAILGWYQYQSYLECKWIFITGMMLYIISKCILYLFIMERLFLIFNKTNLSFTVTQRIISRILFVIYTITALLLSIFFGGNVTFYSEFQYCESNIPTFITIFFAASDIIISAVLSILFARRLLIINLRRVVSNMDETLDSVTRLSRNGSISTVQSSKHIDDNHDPPGVMRMPSPKRSGSVYDVNEKDATFKILTKSTLLTFIALLSTQFTLISIALLGSGAVFGCLDSIINGWCCMLMFASYGNIYSKKLLCGKLEKLITIRCLSCYSCNCCCFELDIQDREDKKRKKDIIPPGSPSLENHKSTSTTKEIVIISDTERESKQDQEHKQSPSPIEDDHHIPTFQDIRSDSDENVDEEAENYKNNLDVTNPKIFHMTQESTAL